MNTVSEKKDVSRRDFLGTAVGAGLTILKPSLVRGTSANSAIRLGLLGCGRRGHVVANSMVNNNNARILALADLFQDRLAEAKRDFDTLAASKGYSGIDSAQLFRGPKAFEQIAASKETDGVIIATPSYFHPEHLEAVVAAGKHV